MKFKFEQKKPEQIMKGILISGMVYVFSLIFNVVATLIPILVNGGMFQVDTIITVMSLVGIINSVLKPIAGIIFIKFICDAFYNLLKAIDIYIEKNQN